jgi:hypothetical protein
MTRGDDPATPELPDPIEPAPASPAPPPRDPDAMHAPTPAPPETPDAPEAPETPAPAAAPDASRVRCLNCGYDLTGAVIGGTCPECGMKIGGGTLRNFSDLPTSGHAIASLVLGICGIVLGCASYGVLSVVCAPLAIFFAGKARKDLEAGTVRPSSAGLATAGRVMGWIAIGLLAVIAVLAGFFCLPGVLNEFDLFLPF